MMMGSKLKIIYKIRPMEHTEDVLLAKNIKPYG